MQFVLHRVSGLTRDRTRYTRVMLLLLYYIGSRSWWLSGLSLPLFNIYIKIVYTLYVCYSFAFHPQLNNEPFSVSSMHALLRRSLDLYLPTPK